MSHVVENREFDAALLEKRSQQIAQIGVVVDEQNLNGCIGHDRGVRSDSGGATALVPAGRIAPCRLPAR